MPLLNKAWVIPLSAVIFTTCTAAESNSSPDEVVGADRDASGCIPSAGYEWSKLQKDCIRIWESGTELTHQGSGDPNYSAYAIIAEDEAELFLPEAPDSLLLFRDTGTEISWTDASSEYRLTYDPLAAMIVTDQNGFVMYKDMSSEPQFDEIPDHSQDDLGGDLIMNNGLVTRVEDGAYPMFTVQIRLDGEADDTVFSFMAEGATVNGARIDQIEGRTVSIKYLDRDVWDLAFISPANAENMDDIEIGEGWRYVTGRLSGASAITQSDLPDLLTIQMMGTDSVEFELYVDEDMVALNDTDVSAWLSPRNSKELLSITVLP